MVAMATELPNSGVLAENCPLNAPLFPFQVPAVDPVKLPWELLGIKPTRPGSTLEYFRTVTANTALLPAAAKTLRVPCEKSNSVLPPFFRLPLTLPVGGDRVLTVKVYVPVKPEIVEPFSF